VWTVCLRLLPDSVAAAIWSQALLLTTRLPSHAFEDQVIPCVLDASSGHWADVLSSRPSGQRVQLPRAFRWWYTLLRADVQYCHMSWCQWHSQWRSCMNCSGGSTQAPGGGHSEKLVNLMPPDVIFMSKMHKILFPLGLCPRPPSYISGSLLLRGGRGRRREKGEGKRREKGARGGASPPRPKYFGLEPPLITCPTLLYFNNYCSLVTVVCQPLSSIKL